MPKTDGYGTFEAPEGTRLFRALEANGGDMLQRAAHTPDAPPVVLYS